MFFSPTSVAAELNQTTLFVGIFKTRLAFPFQNIIKRALIFHYKKQANHVANHLIMEVMEPNTEPDLSKRKDTDKVKREKIFEN